jgi:type II secretory pathway pseudopilin PulG
MGQQQLLLVILVTILVGIATVVAINTFGSSNVNANRDSVRNDVAAISAQAQAWYIKPSMLGGGNNSFVGMTFYDIGFSAEEISSDSLSARNLNGVYAITGRTGTALTLTAIPSSNAGIPEAERIIWTYSVTAGGTPSQTSEASTTSTGTTLGS